MTNILEVITGFQTAVSQVREQKEQELPHFMLYGDDCQFMDTSYVINALDDLKDKLPSDISAVASRIISDLALLNGLINDSNDLIKERNHILDDQESDLRTAFHEQIANVPEAKMDRAVTVGVTHLNEEEIQTLESVYKKLDLTHINREDRKHYIYFNYAETPKLLQTIIQAFNDELKAVGMDSLIKFSNYVHSQSVGGTSDLIKVIQSKQ